MLKKFNPTINLNVLYVKEINIYPVYISKYKLNHENKVILLMIPNGELLIYLAVKKLSALFRRILSKHNGNVYYLN